MTTKKESKPYFITEEVFSQIRESIGSCIPETGGIQRIDAEEPR